MCDYSLHAVASRWRDARYDQFLRHIDARLCCEERAGCRGMSASRTELAFERDIRYNRNWLSTRSTGFSAARFCAIEPDALHQHHDALSFPEKRFS